MPVSILSFSKSHIHALNETQSSCTQWNFIGVYRYLEAHNKHKAWKLLMSLYNKRDEKWLVCTNFNKIIDQNEKWGGHLWAKSQMDAFKSTLMSCELKGLDFRGP